MPHCKRKKSSLGSSRKKVDSPEKRTTMKASTIDVRYLNTMKSLPRSNVLAFTQACEALDTASVFILRASSI